VKRLILLHTLLFSLVAHAILDTNNNGLSDLWEKQYNDGNLFSNTFLPTADPDTDGWNNRTEAAAGTDPFLANPPEGIVATTLLPSATTGTYTLSWPTRIGKRYQLQASTDLESWLPVGEPFIAENTSHSIGINVTQPGSPTPPKLFWHILIDDIDSDIDGLTNNEEHQLGTNPIDSDSDGDEYTDYDEVEAGSSPHYATSTPIDRDGDGNPNGLDAAPDKATIDWTISPEFTYAVIDLNMDALTLSYEGVNAILNDNNALCYWPSEPAGNAPQVWDGTTFPVQWLGLQTEYSLSNEYFSFDNQACVHVWNFLETIQPTSQAFVGYGTLRWSSWNAAPELIGDYQGPINNYHYASRFDQHSIFQYFTTVQTGEPDTYTYAIQSAHVNLTRTTGDVGSPFYLYSSFGFKNVAPALSRAGHIIVEVDGELRLDNTPLPESAVVGLTTDPHDNALVSMVTGDEVQSQRLRDGSWEIMEMPAVIEMSPDGTGLTFPDYQLWRNGATVAYDDIQEDGEWSHYEGYQINRSGLILGSATKTADNLRYPVLLLPAEIVSRDKYLAGSFQIPQGWDSLEMEFSCAGENLGRYGQLLGGGATKIYDRVEDILNEQDYQAGSQADSQKVWFVRDATDTRKLYFYTCFNQTGNASIKLYLSGSPSVVATFHHELTPAQDFAEIITYVDQWVKGVHFSFVQQTPGPLVNAEELHPWTRAALIPSFIVITQVEALTTIVRGLWEGVASGLNDDWQLLVLIKNGVVAAGGWAIEEVENELNEWRTNPLKRVAELKQLTDKLCENWVFHPLREIDESLSSWSAFQRASLRAWHDTKTKMERVWVVAKDGWKTITKGIGEWAEDYGDRMLMGAEKTHWSQHVLITDKLQGDINEYARQASYTFGYTFGYIAEQIIVGVLTDGTVKIGAVLTKGGVSLAGRLAARRALPVVARLHCLKKWAASVVISVEMKAAVERGLTFAASAPLSPVIKDSAAEVLERGMARATYERASFSTRDVLDEAIKAGNIQKLFLVTGREGQFFHKLSLFFHTLGDEATAASTKGWVKAYDRLLKFEGSNFADDRAEDLLALYKSSTQEGKVALRKSLEEFGATDGTGKLWFRDVEMVYEKGYRYSNFDPRFDVNGNPVAGPPKLTKTAEPAGGWYVSCDKFEDATTAISKMQLPANSSARFRLEFDFSDVKNNVLVPRGEHHQAEFFEPLCADYILDGGIGGATQVAIEGIDIPIKAIWDISGAVPLQVFP
jgi:hypothetical protein